MSEHNYILEHFIVGNIKEGDNILEFGPAIREDSIFLAKYCKKNNINYYCLERGTGYGQIKENIDLLINKYNINADLCDYSKLFTQEEYSSYKFLQPKFFDFIFCKGGWPIEHTNNLFKVSEYIGKDNYKFFFIPWTVSRDSPEAVTENTEDYYKNIINTIEKPNGYKFTYYEDDEFKKFHYLMRYKGLVITKNL